MSESPRIVEVSDADLPLHCPMPANALWCGHPRVFIPVQEKGEALCPYCGTLYKLRGWTDQSHSKH